MGQIVKIITFNNEYNFHLLLFSLKAGSITKERFISDIKLLILHAYFVELLICLYFDPAKLLLLRAKKFRKAIKFNTIIITERRNGYGSK